MATRVDERTAAADLAEVRAIAAGDRGAFAALIDRESPRLLRFAQGMLGSSQEAEDVVQDALISLWRSAAEWSPDARIGTWLHTVCYNRAIDGLRRRRTFADPAALDELVDPSELPETRLVQGEAAQSLREAIERLPPRQRSAVLLFHFQDLSQSEAAAVLGVSESALESLLARARRQLRSWLSPQGGDHG